MATADANEEVALSIRSNQKSYQKKKIKKKSKFFPPTIFSGDLCGPSHCWIWHEEE